MAVVSMVWECVAATPNHHFDIFGGFGGSEVCEMDDLKNLIRGKVQKNGIN